MKGMATADTQPEAAPSTVIDSAFQRTVILMSVIVAGALQTLSATIANAVLPQMQGDLSAGLEEISWVLTATMVGTAIGMPAAGWLGMRFGRRRSLLVALGIFTFLGSWNDLFWPMIVVTRSCSDYGLPACKVGRLTGYVP